MLKGIAIVMIVFWIGENVFIVCENYQLFWWSAHKFVCYDVPKFTEYLVTCDCGADTWVT